MDMGNASLPDLWFLDDERNERLLMKARACRIFQMYRDVFRPGLTGDYNPPNAPFVKNPKPPELSAGVLQP